MSLRPPSPPDRDIDSDVYVLGALVIAHSRNANLWYVLSEPLKFNGKPLPNRVCVLLCFIELIVGNRGPGVLNRGHRISLNHHLNYVAGSTGPHLPHLRTDPATNAVDNQGQALAAPCLGRSNGSFGIVSEGVE